MKRLIDILLSFIGLIVLMPLLVIISLLIFLTIGFPLFFSQTRPGLYGKPFPFYKFRTMTHKKDDNDNLLPDKNRLTKFGKFLRKTSMDELPSLWNVLKGDMSLVGPRPLLM